MTEKLYYTSAYTKNWEANIVQSYKKDGRYYVILDRTAFYPEGGGQPSDTGWINNLRVLDVLTEGNEVIHQVEALPTATSVSCKLDWDRRFDHMQHHSGQHLLSAISLKLFEASTLSFHLGKEVVTVDIDLPKMTEAQLSALEKAVNQEIINNRNIVSYFVTAEELQQLPVVKQPKVIENIRIVETEGIEYNPCGGTHVSRTGEIGLMKLLKVEKQKKASRIHFKCGSRALQDYAESVTVLNTIAQKFQTGRNEVLSRFDLWEKENQLLKEKVSSLQEKLNGYEVKELISTLEDSVIITHVFDDKTAKELQLVANTILENGHYIVLLASTLENKLLLSQSGETCVHSGQLVKTHVGAFNGKGGGNQTTAQAGFASREDLLACVTQLEENLRKQEALTESK